MDIREVIEDSEIFITADDEKESALIIQDTLEDFCFYVVISEVAERKITRHFFKAMQPNRIHVLDQRLESHS